MASANHETVTVVKDMGLVASVFNERSLAALDGDQVIGHTRYSTQGDVGVARRPARLPLRRARSGFALAHNGNLTNTAELAERAGHAAGDPAHRHRRRRRAARRRRCRRGALARRGDGRGAARTSRARSASCSSSERRVHGIRDAHGFRPLCLGRFGGVDAPEGWALASESPALDVMGATFVREVAPGELVTIEGTTCTSTQLLDAGRRRAAVHLRVRLLRAARRGARGPRGARRAPTHRRAARAPVARRRRPGDGRAGLGRARRRGLRARERHPVRPGPREEPLHRPDLHRARTRSRARAACGASSTRCASTSPASGSSSSTTRSCAARRRARS